MKVALLIPTVMAVALAASSASADFRAGTGYYDQYQTPADYWRPTPREPGFPVPGQPYAPGYASYYQPAYGGNCSSSYTANGANVSAQSRCRQDRTGYYVQGAAVVGQTLVSGFQAYANYQLGKKNIEAQLLNSQMQAQASMMMDADRNKTQLELARIRAQAPNAAPPGYVQQGSMVMQRRMCATTMGQQPCDIMTMVPTR